MGNPLFEAIERLTNPYAMQERVYRNRRDEQQVHYDALGAYRKVSVEVMTGQDCRHGIVEDCTVCDAQSALSQWTEE